MGNISTGMRAATEEKDLDKLHRMWNDLKGQYGKDRVGKKMFKKLLTQGSMIPQLFGLDKLSPNEYDSSPMFCHHAALLFERIDHFETLWSQGKLPSLRRSATALGRNHHRRFAIAAEDKNAVQFNPMYWSLMSQILTKIMKPYCLRNGGDPQLLAVWQVQFVDHFIDIMQL